MAALAGTIRFTPLYGAFTDGGPASSGPLCYHLKVGDLHLLLDCGWSETFGPEQLEPLRPVAPLVHAVLVSHPHVHHMGALPYAYAKLGLRATVVCTAPVQRLGMLVLYDEYVSRQARSDFDLFDLDDVDAVFDNCVRLKYSQPHALRGSSKGLEVTVTPLAAGHTLGGALWKITVDSEDLVYAVGFNHRAERLLNGTVLEAMVERPCALVVDCGTALVADAKKRQRDTDLVDALLDSLDEGGSVLLPVDAAGRMLELLIHLEQYWSNQELDYPIAMLSYASSSTVQFAKSQLEWMSDAAARAFEDNRSNPFNLQHVRLCHTRKEVDDIPGPKVVLASVSSLESGFSRELFADWAGDIRNTILFTSRAPSGSLAHTLQTLPQEVQFPGINLTMFSKVPLDGEELEAHNAAEAARVAAATSAAVTSEVDSDGRMEDGAEAEGEGKPAKRARTNEEEEEGDRGNVAQKGGKREDGLAQIIGTSVTERQAISEGSEGKEAEEQERSDVLDAASPARGGGGDEAISASPVFADVFCEGFSPDRTAAAPMFPCATPEPLQSRWDEYGEMVNPDDLAAAREAASLTHVPLRSAVAADLEESAAAAAADLEELLMERPCKVVETHITVTVAAAIKYVDYDGRSDGRSVRNILSHVAPMKTILINGSPEATEVMRDFCEERVSPGATLAPRPGQSVDLTADFTSFKVRLHEDLIRMLQFKKLPGDIEVTWVEGQLRRSQDEDESGAVDDLDRGTNSAAAAAAAAVGEGERQQQQEEQQQQQEVEKQLRRRREPLMLAPRLVAAGASPAARRVGVFLGDPKLADFRILLQSHGIEAEFMGEAGVLRCGSSVAVRKLPESSDFVLEGARGELYFRVRRLLYSQFVEL